MLVAVAAGLLLTALDAYVVASLFFPMVSEIGVPLDHLEQATPILSAFFFGYVTAIPLGAALSDFAGRSLVYLGGLALFAAGSAVTAQAQDLTALLVGRGLQGFAGGALVPVALAAVADLYPGTAARVLALGVAAGAQELGSLAGPLYGIGVAQALPGLGGWRAVFWLNIALAAVCAAAYVAAVRRHPSPERRRTARLLPGLALALGMGLLVLAVSPDDPARSALRSQAVLYLLGAAAALAVFAALQGSLLRAVRSGLAVSFFAGAALAAVLAEVPILARTLFGLDDVAAALLLARFLLGVVVGAVAGGLLGGRRGRLPVAGGLLLATGCFVLMAGWTHFEPLPQSLVLLACGAGFGLAIAPVLAAIFDAAGDEEQGAAAALAVLGRMAGMLAGVAVLAAYGLHRFYGDLGACSPGGFGLTTVLNPRFQACASAAVQHQYHDVFLIAAGASGLASVLAVKLGR